MVLFIVPWEITKVLSGDYFLCFFLTENNATFLDNFLTLISLQHLLINYGLRSVLATLYRPLLVEMIY